MTTWENSPLNVPEQAHKFIPNQFDHKCAVCGMPHKNKEKP